MNLVGSKYPLQSQLQQGCYNWGLAHMPKKHFFVETQPITLYRNDPRKTAQYLSINSKK